MWITIIQLIIDVHQNRPIVIATDILENPVRLGEWSIRRCGVQLILVNSGLIASQGRCQTMQLSVYGSDDPDLT